MLQEHSPAHAYLEGSPQQYAVGLQAFEHLLLRGDEQVLDLGCAEGRLTAELAKRLPRGEVTGVDISADMVALAQKNHPHIRFVQQDVQELAMGEGYDLITAQLVAHFFTDKGALLARWRQALKPGGYLLLTVAPAESFLARSIASILDRPRWRPYPRPASWQPAPTVNYLVAATEAGFEMETVELKDYPFEAMDREAYMKSVRGFLPMIITLPTEQMDNLVNELTDSLEPWWVKETGSLKVPQKFLLMVLRAHEGSHFRTTTPSGV